MTMMPIESFSLIVSTLGRSHELQKLFESLAAQTQLPLEVIVVDQNPDDRLAPLLRQAWPFATKHIRVPQERGLSRGRNIGLGHASGDVVLCPDDDCWYPRHLLAHARDLMNAHGFDILAGRACTEEGRSINGRFEERAQPIGRANVWTTQIEWMVFFRRSVLDAIGGYDESIGVGAASPWQACEGQDAVLRALKHGAKAYFDPSVIGHHAELDVLTPDAGMRKKGRMYARGHGHVLRKHHYGLSSALYWAARPLANVALQLVRGNRFRATYYAQVALGRAEGFAGVVTDKL